MENSIEFFLNTHLEWSLSYQDSVITQIQLRQALERTAGWESLARYTLGLHHTHKVQCWGCRQGATEHGGSMSDQLTVFSRGAFVTVCKG